MITAHSLMGFFGFCEPGAPWRDLPADYGHWKNVHRRFCRWRDKGIWEKLLEVVTNKPDYEWLMIDASHIKVHPYGTGAKGGNQDMSRTKGGSIQKYIWPWMRMVCRSELLLQKVPRMTANRECTWSKGLMQSIFWLIRHMIAMRLFSKLYPEEWES